MRITRQQDRSQWLIQTHNAEQERFMEQVEAFIKWKWRPVWRSTECQDQAASDQANHVCLD
jgi:hypothetical protein